MRVSFDWLSDFVDLPSAAELTALLTSLGAEVEEVNLPQDFVSGVVVGRVIEVEKHPDADKLQICQVSAGDACFSVVCGAPNVRPGLTVPYAKPGAVLPGDFKISERKVRGVLSAGMLCARDELGLTGQKEDGLWELSGDLVPGASLDDILEREASLELSITPNRSDLLSHMGVAREIAAARGTRLRNPKWALKEFGPDVAKGVSVSVYESDLCPKYCARVVRNVKVGPSPSWLVERLEAVGLRSINNVVDVTNYVLMEYGQPLHAFDAKKLVQQNGMPHLLVRYAKEGEKAKSLDGVERDLKATDLVIADADKVVAIAGVMGGQIAEVDGRTNHIVLESAFFEPMTVRRTARRLGLHTDSSHRFERHADPGAVEKAIDRCAQLLVEVAGGEVAKGRLAVGNGPVMVNEVSVRAERVSRILGIRLTSETMIQLLEPLGVRCIANEDDALRFNIPSFRPDITREIDLIEELARRFGYNKIEVTMPSSGAMPQPYLKMEILKSRLRRGVLASGYSETIHYAFGKKARYENAGTLLNDDRPVVLLNPLGEDYSTMRTTLLPGILDSISRNQRRGQGDLKFFEIGRVFCERDARDDEDERDKYLPHEEESFAMVLCGTRDAGAWYSRGENVDLGDLIGALETLFEGLRVDVERPTYEHAFFNPYATASLFLSGKKIGLVGELHPHYVEQFSIQGPVYALELSLTVLVDEDVPEVRYTALPKYPAIRKDVAILAEEHRPAEEFRSFIAAKAGGQLGAHIIEDVKLFDVYGGHGIPKGHVSLAFGIVYRSSQRTLTDDEVGVAFDSVIDALKNQFQVEIR
ncbi:MAG: phenylalanine--tRNA ligase subunit beta [Myxococcota bacterium]|nr:phenylalanine--tRNA ligase subunit beta [Myxococcota bacterium]